MKAKKIWIAQHLDSKDVFEVSFRDREGEGEYLDTMTSEEGMYCEYKEYILIEVEE